MKIKNLVIRSASDKEKDVYFERNMAVILAAKLAQRNGLQVRYEFGIGTWPVVYIQLPKNKQVSWHVSHDCIKYLHCFKRSKNKSIWDGHTTDEKHKRIKNFVRYEWKNRKGKNNEAKTMLVFKELNLFQRIRFLLTGDPQIICEIKKI